MKRLFVLIMMFATVVLVGCSETQEVMPTLQPATEAAELAPVESATTAPMPEIPTAPIDTMAHTADPLLVGKLWQWESRDPNGSTVEAITVPNPETYTLQFNADGTYSAMLDCNPGNGRYATPGDGTLTMDIPATTMMLCPDGSLAAPMTALFGTTRSYSFREDDTVLVLGGTDGDAIDTFRMVDEVTTETAPVGELTGVVWQWLGTETPEEPIISADPTRYTIRFNEDGTANIVADCNAVIAQYTLEGSSINIVPGPSTMVACPPDSQDQLFMRQLGSAAIVFFEDGDLNIDLFADTGTMRFSAIPEVDLPAPAEGEATGTVTAPDGIFLRTGPGTNFPSVGAAAQGDSGRLVGISQDGQWYAVDAPGLPGGQVWVAAEFVDATGAEGLPVVAAPAPGPTLVGTTWQWVSQITPAGESAIADPTRYTISFGADGSAVIQADCNSVQAQTIVDGNRLTIIPGASTLVACPPDSQDQLFLQSLSLVTSYTLEQGRLLLDLTEAGNTMRFEPAAMATLPDDGTLSGGAAGLTFRVTSFGPVGAPVAVIPGSTITAVFDDVAATVSGNAGCNSYTGTLTPVEDFFTVGPIATTLRVCDAPAGVMEQEATFLAALGSTNGYLWQQGPGADGATVTTGQLSYSLPDGTNGTINLVSP